MIFRPVTPASPCGPPITKRPVGLTKMRVFSSSSAPGMIGLTTWFSTSSRIWSLPT